MSRTVKDATLATRAARLKLPRGRRHWRSLGGKVHLGYWRGEGEAGRWLLRVYTGQQKYAVEVLRSTTGDKVVADDVADANDVTVLSFEQAQRRAHAVHAEHARIGAGLPATTGTAFTVADCLSNYCDWLDSHRRAGQDARSRAATLVVPVLGTILCEKLTTGQIEGWLRDLANSPPRIRSKPGEIAHRKVDPTNPEVRRARQASANRTLTILRAALNRAWREGQIASNAAWARVRPFRGADAARMRYLSEDEARRLVRAAEPAFGRLLQGALATGCRYGELAALRVEDFNADSGTVHVRRSKTNKGRHVVLGDEGVHLFESACAGRPNDDLIFTRPDGSPWRRSEQSVPMREACKKAMIKPIGFHGTRHTWASLSVMRGMPLLVVAKHLGHRDTKMVELHYGHLAPSFVADAVRQHAPTFGFSQKVAPIRSRRRPA